MNNLTKVINHISVHQYGGRNVLEVECFIYLANLVAKYGVKTDTKELGELCDSMKGA